MKMPLPVPIAIPIPKSESRARKCSHSQRLCSKLAPMATVLEGFLLGLANGVSCLTACAPVLLPFVVGEGRSVRQSILPVASFLCGRLAGYLIFAVLAWETGKCIRGAPREGLAFGTIYLVLALVLAAYGFIAPRDACAASGFRGRFAAMTQRRPAILPAVTGLLTGLSLCPPFVAALAGATSQVSLLSSLVFFGSFFLATSLYVIPFPFAGLLGRFQAIRITGRLAAGVMGAVYFYRSLIMIHGGLP